MDKKKKTEEPSVFVKDGQPETAEEYVNFYGTYNIQPTQSSGNTYPAISQGLDKNTAEKHRCEAKNKKDEK